MNAHFGRKAPRDRQASQELDGSCRTWRCCRDGCSECARPAAPWVACGLERLDCSGHEGCRDPGAVPVVLRAERAICACRRRRLCRASYDPTVLLTTAGMQPFKPYFRGEEEPPRRRLTSCQKSFRTVDIENVGMTARHLTFFEMLGNFSVGDYFKEGAVEFALELSTEEHGSGSTSSDIWITVFGGDEELGLGPDEEAIEYWRAVGVPDERIVRLGTRRQLLAVGPDRALRALLRALPRPRPRVRPRHRPAGRRHRALPRVLEPRLHAVRAPGGWLAARAPHQEHRHRHGARADGEHHAGRPVGLRDRPVRAADRARRGAVRQEVRRRLPDDAGAPGDRRPRPRRRPSCSRTASCPPTRSAATCSGGSCAARSSRATCSASTSRSSCACASACATSWATRIRISSASGPRSSAGRAPRRRASAARSSRASACSREVIDRAKAEQTSWVSAEDAFRLHDTYGFPYEMTKELLAEEGLSVDDQGFEELMERAREVSRRGSSRTRATADGGGGSGAPRRARRPAPLRARGGLPHALRGLRDHRGGDGPARGRARERLAAREARGEPVLSGGRRPDLGRRPGGDPVRPRARGGRLPGGRRPGARARAGRGRDRGGGDGRGRSSSATVASPRCATTPRRTCSTRRCASASARTSARRAPTWGPTSCASTSRTASGSRPRTSPRWSGSWAAGSRPTTPCARSRRRATRPSASARWRCSARSTASACGWWRSRTCRASCAAARTCRRPSEIGLFHVTTETSSASNVRRIEAVTGPEAARLFQERTQRLQRDRGAPQGAGARGRERRRAPERAREGARTEAEGRRRRQERPGGAGRGRGGDRRRRLS